MLRARGIKEEIRPHDGLRVSVMSRHTLNDGVTPDPEITPASYDLWLPSVAPPAELLGDYYKRGLEWKAFGYRYLNHLETNPKAIAGVKKLTDLAMEQTVTIMCIEPNAENCHRSLLAARCALLNSKLILDIR